MIRIAAAIISNDDGKVLLVRKCGTEAFMQPGGKIEAGEDELAALEREVEEELGCRVKEARFVGRFQAPAANEPGQTVEAFLYRVIVSGSIVAQSEIAEIVWVDPVSQKRDDGSPIVLAPLTRDHVLAAR